MKRFRAAGSRSARWRGSSGTSNKKRHRASGVWLLTALAAAALFAFLPAAGAQGNPSANLDQCANGKAPSPNSDGCDASASDWVNGDLVASKANYLEGDSIPYRMRFDDLSTTDPHVVTIAWDTIKSSEHAIDYLDTYTETVNTAKACLGVSGCGTGLGAPHLSPIPIDPHVTAAGVTPIAGDFTFYGAHVTGTSVYHLGVGNAECATDPFPTSDTATYTGDSNTTTCIQISFTTDVANPVLAWGGHIAARKDWGLNNSAVSISGSPYHTRLINLDGAGGNQDRALSEDAVTFPGFIHIEKNTTGGDATFGYTASPSPLANCSITTSGGTGGGPGAANCFFDTITNFQTYTVTENAPPANWAFDSASCTVASPNGGSQSVTNMTATIALKEGEEVTCNYKNHHVFNSPSIDTKLSESTGSIGDTVNDSATLNNATANAGGTVTYSVYTDSACTPPTRPARWVSRTPARSPLPTASCPTRTGSTSTRPTPGTGRRSTRATTTTRAPPASARPRSW